MQGQIEPWLESLQSVATLEQLTERIVALRDTLDVDHLVYHSVNSAGEQYAAVTYSDEWVERYLAEDFARIDPVVQSCYRRFVPMNWKALDWSGRAQREFMEEELGAGVGIQGYSIPVRGPNGQFAIFTVSASANDLDWEQYTEKHSNSLILLAHFVNQKALEIERGSDIVPVATLSPRETDTLRLLAKGMSRAQASDALTISEHTLRVYLEGARFKLGANNTTHAVARALSSGLIVI